MNAPSMALQGNPICSYWMWSILSDNTWLLNLSEHLLCNADMSRPTSICQKHACLFCSSRNSIKLKYFVFFISEWMKYVLDVTSKILHEDMEPGSVLDEFQRNTMLTFNEIRDIRVSIFIWCSLQASSIDMAWLLLSFHFLLHDIHSSHWNF